tara:strand:- start:568 stop:975 length:408 start_codon:yes stop_codon:yes gene_type:complete
MRHLKIGAAAALGLTAGAIFAAPLAASTATTALFGQLRFGEWEFRERGEDRSRRVCLRTERDLVQLRHRGQNCTRILIEEKGSSATVQYSCNGAGYGRTQIRRESADLVQLRSDGIDRGSPFSVEAEGRRVGNCR